MSLTSYRAAPPRGKESHRREAGDRFGNEGSEDPEKPSELGQHIPLADLAATYSPVP